MAYTLASIRQRILEDKLDDEAYPASVVDRFINDTQREIFNTYELPFTEKTFRGSIAPGGLSYELPNDVQVVQTLKVTITDVIEAGTTNGSEEEGGGGGGDEESGTDPGSEGDTEESSPERTYDISRHYLPFREFNSRFANREQAQRGNPTYWTTHGTKLLFSAPVKDNVELRLFYNKNPVKLEDGDDQPEIPAEFEEVLVLGGFIRCLERNEDFDLAAYYRDGEYTRLLDQMLFRLSKRQTGKPMVMGQPSRSGTVRSRRNP